MSGQFNYSISIEFNGLDLSPNLDKITFINSINRNCAIIKIFMNLQRELYDDIIHKNRDNIRLIIQTKLDKKLSDPPKLQFIADLIFIEDDDIDTTLMKEKIDNNRQAFCYYTFTAVALPAYKRLHNYVRNISVRNKTRQEILTKEILKNDSNFEILAPYFDDANSKIEQVFIPPMLESEAIKHFHYWNGLLDYGGPFWTYYDHTGKLWIGNCSKYNTNMPNNPIKILYVTNPNQLEKVIKLHQLDRSEFHYASHSPLITKRDFISGAGNHCLNYDYTFSPLNELTQKFKKELKEFKAPVIAETHEYGKNNYTLKQTQKNNAGTNRWICGHTGQDLATKTSNETFSNQLVSNFANMFFNMNISVGFGVILDDFMNPPFKTVILSSAIEKIRYQGTYFITKTEINFQRSNNQPNYNWDANFTINVSSSIKTDNIDSAIKNVGKFETIDSTNYIANGGWISGKFIG